MSLRNYKSVAERRGFLEKSLKIKLPHIGNFSLDEKIVSVRNCENMIGATQIPLGIAGPIKIKSDEKIINCFVPLATTEGALVASINRGCKAIFESRGLDIEIENIGATRGPVFRVENIREGRLLANYLENNFSQIKKVAENSSHHLTLKKYDLSGIGKYCFVRFYFDTQDAMGLNMVTIATDVIVRDIEKNTKIKCIDLSGNFCIDKKPAWQNFINKRGKAVKAEIVLPHDVLKSVLKTDAHKMYASWLAKCVLGSAMSGSLGFNCQYANVVAAIFIATGQDPAHTVEGSMGITTTEIVRRQNGEDDLYVSVYLPDMMVGTVGGGTGLATQKEALEIMGIIGGDKGGNALKLAKIIGGAVLAGEISLLASLSQGSLAEAHQRLGRGKKL